MLSSERAYTQCQLRMPAKDTILQPSLLPNASLRSILRICRGVIRQHTRPTDIASACSPTPSTIVSSPTSRYLCLRPVTSYTAFLFTSPLPKPPHRSPVERRPLEIYTGTPPGRGPACAAVVSGMSGSDDLVEENTPSGSGHSSPNCVHEASPVKVLKGHRWPSILVMPLRP